MIIGIDGNEANLSRRVGVGQYAFNVLVNLYLLDRNNQYYIYLKDQPLSDMPKTRDNWHYRVFGPGKLWTRLALPFHLYTDSLKLDIFYTPSHYSPLYSPFPTVPTIHDLGYLSTSDQFTPKDLYQLTAWTKQSLTKARHIIAVSQFTKTEICRIYGIDLSKISVIPNGAGDIPKINSTLIPETLAKFRITSPYFLYLGTLKPSKNLPFLISAFGQYLKNSHHRQQLVIAGKKGWLYDNIYQTVANEHLLDSVIFTDYLGETEKWIFYKKAVATVLPSLYEGFGIPALESLQAGTPVIASSIPAFTEILGNSAVFIDPQNSTTLVKAFSQVQNPQIREKLIKFGKIQASKYTWADSARALIAVFNKL